MVAASGGRLVTNLRGTTQCRWRQGCVPSHICIQVLHALLATRRLLLCHCALHNGAEERWHVNAGTSRHGAS